jgi:hypothetical protein
MIAGTPLVLDLNGDGVSTTDAHSGVMFDLNGTGNVSRVGWAAATDGLLVMDRNGDGKINDGRELFGVATVTADGHRAGNGFAALAQEDTNHDGKFSAGDAHFDQVKVWVDANQNGITDAGELKSLADLGIVSMDLNAAKGTELDHGNLLGLVSNYTTNDGKSHELADVWFQKDQAVTQGGDVHVAAQPEVTVSDLLADHGHSAVLDHLNEPTSTTTATPVATVTVDPIEHVSLVSDPLKGLLDDQNKNPLI